MSRKALFFMFIIVSVVCNYFWDNNAEAWRIFGYQAWAVFCAYGNHWLLRDKETMT